MITRVTDNIKYSMITNNMFNIQNQYGELVEKISTQKMINRPSDDPIGTNDILDSRAALSAIQQYQSNITGADFSLTMAETSLSAVRKVIAEAAAISLSEAGNGSAETMDNAAFTVSALIDEALSLMNTKNGDSYLFAGSMTDTQPYTYDSSTGVAAYYGDDADLKALIGKNNEYVYNITGADAFAGTGLLDTLNALKNALTAHDKTLISAQTSSLQTLETKVLQSETLVGAKRSSLEVTSSNHDSMKLQITNMLADTENADMTQLITEFQMKQVSMQAMYNMASKIGQLTIMDYL